MPPKGSARMMPAPMENSPTAARSSENVSENPKQIQRQYITNETVVRAKMSNHLPS